METVGDRIRRLRRARKLSQEALAKAIGVQRPSVTAWELGTTKHIRPEHLFALAKALHVNPESIYSIDLKLEQTQSAYHISQSRLALRHVPLRSWGSFTTPHVSGTKHSQEGEKMLPCPTLHSEEAFALKVRGVSMEPNFFESEYIFVDPQRKPLSGQFVLAKESRAAEPVLRQFISEGGQRFLKATNPSWPNPISPLAPTTEIIGTIIFKGREFV